MSQFESLLEECTMKIDIAALMDLIELLDRDELGVRIYQMALEICANVILEYPSLNTEVKFFRMNASGSSHLQANPYVKTRSNFATVLNWDNYIPQKPDGLFTVTVKNESVLNGSIDVVVQYEADGYAKGSAECLQIMRKFYQGIDLQLTQKDAKTATWSKTNSCYAVRSNLAKILVDEQQEEPIVAWVYNFLRSHIFCVLLMLNNIVFPKKSDLSQGLFDKKGAKRKGGLYDHMFFIGAFELNFKSHVAGFDYLQDLPEMSDFSESSTYLTANRRVKNAHRINNGLANGGSGFLYGINLPWPKMQTSDNTSPQWSHFQQTHFEMHTYQCAWIQDNLEVQSVSFQRCFRNNNENSPAVLDGLITPWHIKEAYDLKLPVLHNLTITTFLDQSIAFLTLMSPMETVLLDLLNAATDDVNTITSYQAIQWQGEAMGKKCISVGGNQNTKGLNEFKMELRNAPHKYRHRKTFPLKDLFQKSTSLQACAIKSLSDTLPVLDQSIARYLDNFNIPNAVLFCRMLRVPNILALREMARRSKHDEIAQQYQALLKTLPLGTQTELLYLFDRLRNELDIVLNPETYAKKIPLQHKPNILSFAQTVNETLGLGFDDTTIFAILSTPNQELDATLQAFMRDTLETYIQV